MPKKKPLTPINSEHLQETLHDGYSCLLAAKSIIAGYLKKDDPLRKKLGQFCSDYRALEIEFANAFRKQC